MIDYSKYTLEQLISMMNQEIEIVKMDNEKNAGRLPFIQMARIADMSETIGLKYIVVAHKIRNGEPVNEL